MPKRCMSAHLQLEYFRGLRKFGRSPREAIGDVTKWLRSTTEAGNFTAGAASRRRPRCGNGSPTWSDAAGRGRMERGFGRRLSSA
ncbi:hypothetical protein XI05_22980 [Bradyrhizobium sp. CCBAU 11357]|nr:hypothetical protein [Bradyrhizobium sp. CCBAU 11357]